MAQGLDQQPAGVLPLAQQLHAAIGRPIDAAARAQGAQRLVLWLDGPLRYLPLGLLHDGRQHLSQTTPVADRRPPRSRHPPNCAPPRSGPSTTR